MLPSWRRLNLRASNLSEHMHRTSFAMSLTQSRETRDLPNAGAIPLSTHAPFSHPSKLCQGGLLASSARTALFLRSTFVQRVRELQRSFYTSCLQVYQGPWRTPSTVEFPQLGILHIMKSEPISFSALCRQYLIICSRSRSKCAAALAHRCSSSRRALSPRWRPLACSFRDPLSLPGCV